MTDHRTIHRYIPPGDKHPAKTACGIYLVPVDESATEAAQLGGNGYMMRISHRGEKLDCARCLDRLRIRQPAKAS